MASTSVAPRTLHSDISKNNSPQSSWVSLPTSSTSLLSTKNSLFSVASLISSSSHTSSTTSAPLATAAKFSPSQPSSSASHDAPRYRSLMSFQSQQAGGLLAKQLIPSHSLPFGHTQSSLNKVVQRQQSQQKLQASTANAPEPMIGLSVSLIEQSSRQQGSTDL